LTQFIISISYLAISVVLVFRLAHFIEMPLTYSRRPSALRRCGLVSDGGA